MNQKPSARQSPEALVPSVGEVYVTIKHTITPRLVPAQHLKSTPTPSKVFDVRSANARLGALNRLFFSPRLLTRDPSGDDFQRGLSQFRFQELSI